MSNDLAERLLVVPTKPRNELEEQLLEQVELDPDIKNPQLRTAVTDYATTHKCSLVVWRHDPANITRRSFEDSQLAQRTRESYKGQPPTPRIAGIQVYI